MMPISFLNQLRLSEVAKEWAAASDRELLEAYTRCRTESAFMELIRRHGPMVVGICRRILTSIEDTEDAFQAIFALLASKPSRVHRPERLEFWLRKVAIRTASEMKRKITRHETLCRQVHAKLTSQAQESGCKASWDDIKPILDEELECLPEQPRQLLIRHYLQGKTYAQIAVEFGLPSSSVGYHLAQARELLRRRLMRRDSTLSVGMLGVFLEKACVEAAVSPLLVIKAHAVAMAFASGALEAVPAQVAAALPRGILSTLTATQKKLVLVISLCLGLTGAGVAVGIALKGHGNKAPVPERIARPEQAKKVTPDPSFLPEGALSWLGTTKIRSYGGYGIHAVAFASDGKTLAVGGMDHIVDTCGDGGIGLWEITPGEDLCWLKKPVRWLTKRQPGTFICGLAFSPNGKVLAAGYKDVNGGHQRIVLWDKITGKELDRWTWDEGKGELSFGLAFSPDGTTLAAGGNQSVRLWDGTTSKKTVVGEGGATAVVFSPDGNILAAADNKTVRLLDSATGKVIRQFSAGEVRSGYPIRSLAFTSDGRSLVTPGEDRTVRLWEVATGKEIRKFEGHGDGVCAVALASDKAIVASTDGVQAVRLWDMTTGQELYTFDRWGDKPVKIRCLTFSPDGKVLAATIHPISPRDEFPETAMVQLWDVATGKEIASGHRGSIKAAAYSRDSRTITTLASDNTIRKWDAATGQELHVFNGHRKVARTASFSPDGKKLAVAGHDGSAWLWDVVNGQELRKWDILNDQELRKLKAKKKDYIAVKFSPDGQSLATGGPAGQVTIWQVNTGKRLSRFQVCDELVTALAFSPDGTRLVTAGNTSPHKGSVRTIVKMWEMASGKAIPWRKDLDVLDLSDNRPVRRIAFSADTRFLLVSSDNVASVWELASGREVARLPTGRFLFALSPDGRMAATGNGNDVFLWDLAAGKEVARLTGHKDSVQAAAFSPDGRQLVSVGDDCAGLVWDVARWVTPAEGVTWAKEQLEAWWNDLGSVDAATAYWAAWSLAKAAPQSVPWLRAHVRPMLAPARDRLAMLIADLDSEDSKTREKAGTQLAQLGSAAESSLRRALVESRSASVQKQIECLLEGEGFNPLTPTRLQQIRAVQVLEWARTLEALEVLTALAKGEPDAWLTKEAKKAVTRLAMATRPSATN
jgi:RNA polymerase sigma factor (sigma-70 family)